MTAYRRHFVAGGSYFFTVNLAFFTVNLADRRLRLLTDHIDALRAAFGILGFDRRSRSTP